jgi:RNA-directed DNA polymerase
MNKKFDIKSIEQLASMLGFSTETLIEVSSNLKSYFHYRRFSKGNKTRTLIIPHGKFNDILKAFNKKVLQKVTLPVVIKGGIKEMSIYKNAEVHCGQKVVATFDIKNFYPSINSKRVRHTLLGIGCSESVVDLLVKLTTCNGCVPLGFPTSPALANIILISMANRFQKLSEQHNLRCSFWIDDITLSGSLRVSRLKNLFRKIVTQEGFVINEKKSIKFMKNSVRQVVTKLSVNGTKPKVMREYRMSLRSLLYRCRILGPESQTRGCLKKFKRSILGKISFVKSIDEVQGVKLGKQFNRINWN